MPAATVAVHVAANGCGFGLRATVAVHVDGNGSNPVVRSLARRSEALRSD